MDISILVGSLLFLSGVIMLVIGILYYKKHSKNKSGTPNCPKSPTCPVCPTSPTCPVTKETLDTTIMTLLATTLINNLKQLPTESSGTEINKYDNLYTDFTNTNSTNYFTEITEKLLSNYSYSDILNGLSLNSADTESNKKIYNNIFLAMHEIGILNDFVLLIFIPNICLSSKNPPLSTNGNMYDVSVVNKVYDCIEGVLKAHPYTPGEDFETYSQTISPIVRSMCNICNKA